MPSSLNMAHGGEENSFVSLACPSVLEHHLREPYVYDYFAVLQAVADLKDVTGAVSERLIEGPHLVSDCLAVRSENPADLGAVE